MGTIAQKIQKAQQSKEAIKAALIAKGVDNVDDVMAHYAGFIDAINIASGGDLDFTKIGYNSTPKYLTDGMAYAEEIKNNWDPSSVNPPEVDIQRLEFFPDIDMNNVKKAPKVASETTKYVPPLRLKNVEIASSMFFFCNQVEKIEFVFPTNKLKICSNMFQNCYKLKEFPKNLVITSNVTNLQSTFQGCVLFKRVPLIETCNVTDINYAFYICRELEKIELLDFSSINTDFGSCFTGCDKLSYLLIKNIGRSSFKNGDTVFNFTGLKSWGDGVVEGSAQSLRDSLITYSYDRKSNNMATATLKLHTAVMDRLSDDEKSLISAKGYILSL